MMEETIINLLNNKIKILNALKNDIRIANKTTITINIQKLEQNEEYRKQIDFQLNKFKSGIYIVKSEKQPSKNEVQERFDIAKKQYAMCRINDQKNNNHWTAENCYIYIGSSENIYKRLKNHLDLDKSEKTYSLHIQQWYKTGNINIEIYEFKNTIEEIQEFEDLLWSKHKPLFGRQGKK